MYAAQLGLIRFDWKLWSITDHPHLHRSMRTHTYTHERTHTHTVHNPTFPALICEEAWQGKHISLCGGNERLQMLYNKIRTLDGKQNKYLLTFSSQHWNSTLQFVSVQMHLSFFLQRGHEWKNTNSWSVIQVAEYVICLRLNCSRVYLDDCRRHRWSTVQHHVWG